MVYPRHNDTTSTWQWMHNVAILETGVVSPGKQARIDLPYVNGLGAKDVLLGVIDMMGPTVAFRRSRDGGEVRLVGVCVCVSV